MNKILIEYEGYLVEIIISFWGELGYVTCAHFVVGTARVAPKSWLRACRLLW